MTQKLYKQFQKDSVYIFSLVLFFLRRVHLTHSLRAGNYDKKLSAVSHTQLHWLYPESWYVLLVTCNKKQLWKNTRQKSKKHETRTDWQLKIRIEVKRTLNLLRLSHD